MKNLFKFVAVSAAFAFATSNVMATEKIAYVDSTYLLQNHPQFTDPNSEFVQAVQASRTKIAEEEKQLAEVDKKLAEDLQKHQAEEKALSESLQKKVAALEKEAPKLRSADIKKRQDAINAEAQAFQKKTDALQQREQAFRADVDAFHQRVTAADRELAEKREKIKETVVPEIRKAISETAKSKGFTLVLDSNIVVHSEHQGNELTEEIYKTFPKPAAK